MINAITERKGVKTALITTEGFRDSLEIARGNRPDYFNLHYEKPPPFVPRYLRREVPGPAHPRRRASAQPLDLARLAGDRRRLPRGRRRGGRDLPAPLLRRSAARAGGARARARALAGGLGRRLAPDHARVARVRAHEHRRALRVRAAGRRALPDAPRRAASATAGFAGQLYIMQSNCGVDSVEKTKAIPITMVESGPASGFWGAAELGRLIGEPNVLALDIGGTTAKCSLIEGGHVKVISDYWIEREPPLGRLPDHGAGRRPRRDRQRRRQHRLGRRLREAARRAALGRRACPGPAAYGRGGTEATTTDANLALGRINRDYFCGGEIEADMDGGRARARRGRRAPRRRPRRGGARHRPDREQQHGQRAQAGLASTAATTRATSRSSPSAAAAGCTPSRSRPSSASRKVVIPRAADVFSAWGMLMSDLRRDYFLTRLVALRRAATRADARRLLAELTRRALAQFAREGHRRRRRSLPPLRQPPLREPGARRRDRRCRTARSTRRRSRRSRRPSTSPTSASTPTASTRRSSSSAPTSSRSPRSASSSPARLPVTGRSLDGRRRRATRASTSRPRASTRPTIYDGDLLEPGMRVRRPGDRRDEGHDDRRPSRRTGVDGRRLRQPLIISRREAG